MTIVQYITPSRMGGAETYFLGLCEFLARRGHRVIVVTKRDCLLRVEAEKLRPLGVQVHGWHTRGKFDPRTLFRLVRLLRRERADVLNTHLTTASWVGAWAGKLAGVPCAAWVHGRDKKTWFQWADHLLAVAEAVREFLVEQGVSACKVEVLPFGVDLTLFAPFDETQKRQAKASFGLSPQARTLCVVASLIERKGHRFLLEALAYLPADVEVLLAGEGPLEGELRAQSKRLNIESRVHFLGFQSDVKRVLAASDVFCLPSLKEGLPISVMEAQACQLVVVAARTAGVPEVVSEGRTGFLSAAGDAASLRDALERALDDPVRAREIGKRARVFLEHNYAREERLAAIEGFLTRLCRESIVK